MFTQCCRSIGRTIEEMDDIGGEYIGVARYAEHIATDELLLPYCWIREYLRNRDRTTREIDSASLDLCLFLSYRETHRRCDIAHIDHICLLKREIVGPCVRLESEHRSDIPP